MRIALLADIHGNPNALEAVLADLERSGGADIVWVLGDLVALGPSPVAVLERLASLENARISYGNTDRYLSEGMDRANFDRASADPAQLTRLLDVAISIAWTQGAVTQAGWLPWLEALPLELRTTLPDGSRVLGVHAAPGAHDGPGIHSGQSEDELRDLIEDCEADLLLVGHTHRPLERRVTRADGSGVHIVNFGPVSMHFTDEKRAIWALLEADENGYRLERRFVDYDRGGAMAELERLHHPAAEFIADQLRDPTGETRS